MIKQSVFTIVFAIAASSFAADIPTRFGTLKINDENMLLYKERPLTPEIQGNNGLSMTGLFRLDDESDIVLIQDSGGTACPASFYFITISSSGAKSTPNFGSCSDLISIKPEADTITVTMPGFEGPFGSESAQTKAAKKKFVYVYKGGVVLENGKPIK